MSKKTESTTTFDFTERIQMLAIFNQFKGNLETLTYLLDDTKKLVISEDEKTLTEFVPIEVDGVITSYNWNSSKDPHKEIELSQQSVDYIKAHLDQKSQEGEITMKDAALLAIYNKIK